MRKIRLSKGMNTGLVKLDGAWYDTRTGSPGAYREGLLWINYRGKVYANMTHGTLFRTEADPGFAVLVRQPDSECIEVRQTVGAKPDERTIVEHWGVLV